MIATVSGTVSRITLDGAVVDVGGVGFAVRCTPATLAELRLGQQAQLSTHLIVREDELTLYGFADDDEKAVFETVQTVSGVGPRLAQAMLAVHSPDVLRRAVAAEDLTTLMRVPGVGKKGAQRLVLELKDKLGAPTDTVLPTTPTSTQAPWRDQLTDALTGLGYTPRDAESALDSVAPLAEAALANGSEPDTAALLRAALRGLSRA